MKLPPPVSFLQTHPTIAHLASVPCISPFLGNTGRSWQKTAAAVKPKPPLSFVMGPWYGCLSRKENETKQEDLHMGEIKCIIAGGRDFTNYEALKKALATVKFGNNKVTIISGTARGADSLGERYAKEKNYELMRFPANWNKYGRSAGMIRNKQMLEQANCVICFWDGKSPGTRNMIQITKAAGKPVAVFDYDGNLSEYNRS